MPPRLLVRSCLARRGARCETFGLDPSHQSSTSGCLLPSFSRIRRREAHRLQVAYWYKPTRLLFAAGESGSSRALTTELPEASSAASSRLQRSIASGTHP